MLGHAGPILAVCWAYVRPMFGQGGTYVQQLAKFWVMFKNVEKHRVLEQKRGHSPLCWTLWGYVLGPFWHMLSHVGPILVGPMFSQERYVMPNRAYVELMLGPFWPHVGQC